MLRSAFQTKRRPPLPPGATEANWFGLFNAISWQITLGSPTILYAKSLGASATILGLIASLTPLLVILQLPAAHLLPKYGYRKFIMAGWGSRTVCIFGLVVVPQLVWLAPSTRLLLVLLLLFGFNVLRGMAAGAWMPWITQLIPEESRARFLSRDQMFAQLGCLVSLAMAAVTLSREPLPWQFSVVFLFSALGATASLIFIRRIPDVTTPEQLKASGTKVPWKHMIAYPPFLKLTIFNLLYVCAVGGMGVFSISFMRSYALFSERLVVMLTTTSVIGAITVLPHTATLLDRFGSRKIMIACLASFAMVLAGWSSLAAGVIPCSIVAVGALLLLAGITGVNYQVANNRLAMSIIPQMGRNHFFAMFTVITNVAAGLSPIVWGLILDIIGARTGHMAGIELNRYSVFYATTALFALVTASYGVRLKEKTRERELERSIAVNVTPQASGSSPMASGGTPATTAVALSKRGEHEGKAPAEPARSRSNARV